MRFNRDIYHLCMAYIGAGILAIALVLEIYHKINVYNQIILGCLIGLCWINKIKKNEL